MDGREPYLIQMQENKDWWKMLWVRLLKRICFANEDLVEKIIWERELRAGVDSYLVILVKKIRIIVSKRRET